MKKSKITLITIFLLLIFLAACGGQESATPTAEPPAVQEEATAVPPTEAPPTEVPPTEVPSVEEPTIEPAPEEMESRLESMEHNPDPRLVGITWEWVERNPNGNDIPQISVPNPENYTLIFNENGTFNARIDCNDGAGRYATPSPGSIFMELGPITLALCPEGTLDMDMTNMFGPAQNYVISDDGSTLQMNWVAGGPIDTFRNGAVDVPGDEEIRAIPPDTLVIDTGSLAESFQWEVVPGSPIPPGPGGQGFPPHIIVTFDEQTAQDAEAENGAIMYIFPTEAYVAMYNSAGSTAVVDQVLRLQELIASAPDRTSIPESPMPLLPPPSSYMGRWAQFADLNFGVGSGIRYVSEAPNRQGIGPWTNLGTAYYYQGLTSDNKYYVSLRWPVSTPALPNTPDDVPDDVTAESTNPDTYPTYLQDTIDTLNALTAADWSPDLDALDSLAASIDFPLPGGETAETGTETPEPGAEEDVDLAEPQTGVATGTVTAPDGVFIRTGPGTDYPSIGALPFDESGEIIGVSEDGEWWVFEVPAGLKAPNNQGWVSAQFIAAENAANVPVIEAPSLEPGITGTTWEWVSLTTPVEMIDVENPASYTILFNEDSTAAIKADCNNVNATYTIDGSSINITLGAGTLAACPEGSLDQQFLTGLDNAAIYFFEDGDLFIDMFASAGTLRFSPPSGQPAVPPTPAAPPDSLDSALGVVFKVVSFGPSGSATPVLEGTNITALFESTQVSGSAGCNDYTATLTPVDDHFTVGPVASTKKLCNEPAGIMEQEQAFLTALGATNGFQWASELVNGATVVTAGQLFYTTAENLPGVINLVSQ